MKTTISLLAIMLLSGSWVAAQQKKETEHMLISAFYQNGGILGFSEKVIVTKDDGTQETIKDHKLPLSAFGPKGFHVTEDSLMQMLKPYFAGGWKLVTVASLTIPLDNYVFINRYFLSKEEGQ
jgi:hypothetical protein